MEFRDFLQQNIVRLDGGMGTLLQQAGLPFGELPERWNITHSETVSNIHRDYFNAGSDVVCTNTFGANILKFSEAELEQIIAHAVKNARNGADRSQGEREKFVALDIGPTGKLLKPFGDLAFENAVEIFAKTVRLGVKYGVDLIFIETMSDCYETKAALLAAKENSTLPVLVCNAYGADGKLMTGASPAAMVAMLEGMGVDGLGANCSLGPKHLKTVVEELLEKASVPVVVKPNAGLPQTDGENVFYETDACAFARDVADFVRLGARAVGGCCGTTPAYIQALCSAIENVQPIPVTNKNVPCVSSYTHAVALNKPCVIGCRLCPTQNVDFQKALQEGDMDYALDEGIDQQDQGADILLVNVGLSTIDEEKILQEYVEALQSVVRVPLLIQTNNASALEKALRVYNGKPLVCVADGDKESMQKILPLLQKYGGEILSSDCSQMREVYQEYLSLQKEK